ncbi:MAG: CRISPR-associated endoribonuclease Cas6 [Bacteroidales bacterium]
MRFRLTLENTDKGLLPLNYQYELSAWIYKTLNYGNREFADWLHREGYTNDYKQFKLFTFSNLLVPEYHIEGDRMKIESRECELIVSFYPINSLEYFVSGLFSNQAFSIGDKRSKAPFAVKTVEKLPEPEFRTEMEFKALSPILVSYKKSENQKYARYMQPGDEEYGDLLIKNLAAKYRAFYSGEPVASTEDGLDDTDPVDTGNMDYTFKPLSKPKSRLITIKKGSRQESKLRGYLYRFRLKAPVELIRLGYYAGFGEKNSLGFGCGEVSE